MCTTDEQAERLSELLHTLQALRVPHSQHKTNDSDQPWFGPEYCTSLLLTPSTVPGKPIIGTNSTEHVKAQGGKPADEKNSIVGLRILESDFSCKLCNGQMGKNSGRAMSRSTRTNSKETRTFL